MKFWLGTHMANWLDLWLAFGSLAFFWGQAVGKAWMTLLAIMILYALRRIPKRKLALT